MNDPVPARPTQASPMKGVTNTSLLIGAAMGAVAVLAIVFARGVFALVDEPFKAAANAALNLIPGIAAFAAALLARQRPVANGLAAAALAVAIGFAAAVLLPGPYLLFVAVPLLVELIPLAIEAWLGALIGAWIGRRLRGAQTVETGPPDRSA